MTPFDYWRGWLLCGAIFLVALYVVVCAALCTAHRFGWFR
jgi:hypothetical protein